MFGITQTHIRRLSIISTHLPHIHTLPRTVSYNHTMSTDSKTHDGGCKCGYVRFTATGNPKAFRWCHCYRCRVDNSSAGVYETNYDSNKFQHNITDDMINDKSIYTMNFGKTCTYYRCTKCDTRVFDINRSTGGVSTYPSLFDWARHNDGTAQVKQLPDGWKQTEHIYYHNNKQHY